MDTIIIEIAELLVTFGLIGLLRRASTLYQFIFIYLFVLALKSSIDSYSNLMLVDVLVCSLAGFGIYSFFERMLPDHKVK